MHYHFKLRALTSWYASKKQIEWFMWLARGWWGVADKPMLFWRVHDLSKSFIYGTYVLHKLLPWIGFTSVHFISLLSWNLYTYVSDCSIYSHMLGFLLKESNKCRSQWPLFGSRHIPFKLHQWTKFNER